MLHYGARQSVMAIRWKALESFLKLCSMCGCGAVLGFEAVKLIA